MMLWNFIVRLSEIMSAPCGELYLGLLGGLWVLSVMVLGPVALLSPHTLFRAPYTPSPSLAQALHF